ncbi:hypothetical protein [Kitasatospora griseola]|uniref:hypothetical protein n=1 Tax=Kitasatospora griseola TaxID=2064 RepID=UPI00166FE50A|nr:hypothetical protein [Kitasatospora griseola]GGQ65166.1 hypothetical protein GCM10010195_20930 [Kitasatospora griseola]
MIAVQRPDYQDLLAEARRRLAVGTDIEALLEWFKELGFHQVDCIFAVIQLELAPQSEAKRLVHYSRAWSATRKQSEELHEALLQEVADDPDLDVRIDPDGKHWTVAIPLRDPAATDSGLPATAPQL